ncbi:MAG: hypothetical protein KJ718_06005 [Nanoarchaeota archaeon]|nr:hypothetical protein [Nanoarchaeota archaeon]MBU1988182.1 hypothetical protein [Nanoarchaeota archaeon]
MKMNKKIILSLMFLFLLTTFANSVYSEEIQSEEVNIYFFWAHGCPHCQDEKDFLNTLNQKYDNLDIHGLEVTTSKENADLLKKTGKELNADVSGVPFTVVGEQYFSGWYNEETTGKAIEDAVNCVIENHCQDVVGELTTPISQSTHTQGGKAIPERLDLPIIGEVETKNLSLPVLTIIIAALDGFNPCAMWVLLFLISLLLGMQSKKRMWVFGTVFIATSAFVYFLFMSAWLNLFLFLGFVFWVRLAIGFVALGAGIYNIREYFTNPAGTCKVTGTQRRQKIFEKLKKIVQEKHVLLALLGLIVLAFAVNLVELICSAGLPAVYTQILTLTNLEGWQYYSYLLLYVFIFMLDDLFVFFVAMITLQAVGVTNKYGRISHIVGGIIMLIMGALLIFKPELLMFG